MTKPSIVWFRQDLRVADNPALCAAAQRGPVVPLYIWSPEEEGQFPPGGASKWWLHRSLQALERGLGIPLVLRQGGSLEVLRGLIAETGASHVFWNRRYRAVPLSKLPSAGAAA